MSDLELLQQYVRTHSEEAFAGLVQRHIDWVYSAAVRQVRDRHLAEDVTQAVFIALAQRAESLRLDRPLSPWLLQVARYTSATALRAEARRKRHEQEAAAMMLESSTAVTEDEWGQFAPVLDELVAGLRMKDRQAVLLRFYERKSFVEVGQVLGISEEAARKRVDRAVEKLHAMFTRRGLAVTSAALAAALIARTTQPASAALAAAATQAALATLHGTTITSQGMMLAKGTFQMMSWAKAKVLVGVVLGVAGLAGLGTAMVVAGGGAKQRQVASSPIDVAPVLLADADQSEAQVPGLVQLARWDVILDQLGAEAVQKVGRPLQTASKMYEAMACNGADVRRVVREAMATGAVIRASTEMNIADEWPPEAQSLRFHRNLWFGYGSEGARVMLVGGSNQPQETLERVGQDRLRLKLNHPDMKVDINERTDRWRWAGLKGQAIAYDGNLAAGEAVAFLGQFTAASGTSYYHLAVWETFKAERRQMRYMSSQRGSEWWCQNGPAQMRKWANAARVWEAQAAHDLSKVAAPFEKKLEDGKIVRLVALGRPRQWPFCWWDTEGKPVAGNYMLAFEGDPPDGLWALVQVWGPSAEEYRLKTPTGKAMVHPVRQFDDSACNRIPDGATALDVGVQVGPWKELARPEVDQPLTIQGVTYRLDRPSAINPDDFLVHFTRTGVLDHEDCLTAVGEDGTETEPFLSTSLIYGRNLKERTIEQQPNLHGVPLEKVQYFRLSQRKRQWVTFNGFATEPEITPKTAATRCDVNRAEKEQQRRQEQVKLDQLQEQRKAWAAIVPDTASQLGVARMLVDAVKRGDEKAARRLLVTQRIEASRRVDALAHLLVIRHAMRCKAVARFGEPAVKEALDNFGLFRDVEADLLGEEWDKKPDGSIAQGPIAIRRNADGRYYLDLDAFADLKTIDARLQFMTAKVQELDRLLTENKTVTLEEVKAAMERALATR